MIHIERINRFDLIYEIMEKHENDFFSRNIDRKKLAEKMSRFGCFLVSYFDEDIAGFAGYYANDMTSKTGYLSVIVISQKYRGKGVGNRLLRECLDDCRRRGMKKCRLEVNKSNQGAIRFYIANGFVRESSAGEISDYYICYL